MAGRFAYIRERLNTSIWFIPIALSFASALLAVATLWLDRHLAQVEIGRALVSLDLESARRVLGVVAGSIIGVGGVAFSLTMVALTLTSGQYGPKVLRNFLEDSFSKITLGLFLGTYVYTLIVLSAYSSVVAPRFTVFLALVLAFVALLGFVGFVHRTATDLQADKIIHRIGTQLQGTMQSLAEDGRTTDRTWDTAPWRRLARKRRPKAIASNIHGYVQAVDYGALTRWAKAHECLVQVRVRGGDFVVEGGGLFKVYAGREAAIGNAVEDLNACLVAGPMRTPVQDPEHPITQLIQLAGRALSPGINDPGTAITCIDWFGLALSEIIDHDLPGCVFLDEDGEPRLLARVTDFAGLAKAIYAPLRQLSGSDVAVTARLLESLGRLAELTHRSDRLDIIARHGDLIAAALDQRGLPSFDLSDILRRHRRLKSLTRAPSDRV